MSVEWAPPAADPITTGELVTPADYLNPVANALLHLERVAFQNFVSNVNVTATTEAGATTIVTLPALDLDAIPYYVLFSTPRLAAGVAAFRLALFSGATNRGLMASMDASTQAYGIFADIYTPAAPGSETLSMRGWSSSAATAIVAGGAGGTGTTFRPGWMALYRVPTPA